MIELVSSAAEKAVPTAPLLELGGDGWTLGSHVDGLVQKFDILAPWVNQVIHIYIYIYIWVFRVRFPGDLGSLVKWEAELLKLILKVTMGG